MEYATKFCLIFCVTSVFCSVSEALNNTDNSTSQPTEIDCDDFCRLGYHANDTALILKPGEYKIRKDGTLFIDLNNSTLNKTLFEVWSNDSATNATDCEIRYDSWQFLLGGHLVSVIALHFCLAGVVIVNDPVKLIEVTTHNVFFLIVASFIFIFVRLSDCPQTHLAIHVFVHYVSVTWVFWKSSAVFDSFVHQVRYRRAGGFHDDMRFTNKNVIVNFAGRMVAVAMFTIIQHVFDLSLGIKPIAEEGVECGVPHRTMYLTLRRSVVAYLAIGFINYENYRRCLAGMREVATEHLRILKDLCDLDFVFFSILAFTWLSGCLFPEGDFVFYASILELAIFLMLLCNFLRYCYRINWHGAFV